MYIRRNKEYIIIEGVFFYPAELSLTCGALSSVFYSKAPLEITVFTSGEMILKNYKYEVSLDPIYLHDIMEWKDREHILRMLLPIRNFPPVPPSKVREVRKDGNTLYYKIQCSGCHLEADRENVIYDEETKKNLCPICRYEKEQNT